MPDKVYETWVAEPMKEHAASLRLTDSAFLSLLTGAGR